MKIFLLIIKGIVFLLSLVPLLVVILLVSAVVLVALTIIGIIWVWDYISKIIGKTFTS